MKQIKVLIVDDSLTARRMLKFILSADNDIKVSGEAKNGKEAIERVKELNPDIVTMDIEMPEMNGLEAVERIMEEHAVPIIVITEKSVARYAFDAISRGALEIISKSDINMENASALINKIKLLAGVKVITHIRGKGGRKGNSLSQKQEGGGFDKAVAVACSTGGPKALSVILPELPQKFPFPVFVAQHISDGFTGGLVEWLNGISKIPVREGADGETIKEGTIYISPSERHMTIDKGNRIALVEKKPADIYHPSCNLLLASAADVFGAGAVGIILTGMGDDGVSGIKKIKEAGGLTIAQDEKTSAIFGMPRVAIESGCIDKVLPLNEIGREIVRIRGNDRLAEVVIPNEVRNLI